MGEGVGVLMAMLSSAIGGGATTFILAEPVGLNLLVGIAAVLAGIWLASTEPSGQVPDPLTKLESRNPAQDA